MKNCNPKRICAGLIAFLMVFSAFSGAGAVAAADVTMRDAAYTGEATVLDTEGDFADYGLTVDVVMNGSIIESITAAHDSESYDEDNDPYWNYAVNGRTRGGVFYPSPLSQIVEKQSTEDIDVVSGATRTSVALIEAVNDALSKVDNEEPGTYVLMNIPYDKFYNAEGVSVFDIDAMSSATSKVGNVNKAGGSYHSAQTADYDEEGNIVAVGKENGAHLEGVIWPVYVEDAAVLNSAEALGGIEITDDRTVIVASAAHGNTNAVELVGRDSMMEAPSYSYYILDDEPAYYMSAVLNNGEIEFNAVENEHVELEKLEMDVSYSTHWGDVQFDIINADEVQGKQVNAMIITAEDGNAAGMIHLYNIWAYNSIAWNADNVDVLDGKTITSIRYYCNDKQGNYFVYDYTADETIPVVYKGQVEAEFINAASVGVSGIPEDAENVTAIVYYSVGKQRTYLTETYVDENGRVQPIYVPVENGSIALVSTLDEEKTVTVEFLCDNYIIRKTTAVYIPPMLGDIDGDGEVSVLDAILALRFAMGLDEFTDTQIAAGDVNGSGNINTTDALLILRYSMGSLEAFPA